MQDYYFFQKDDQTIAVEITDIDRTFQLIEQGYKKQFEEISAANEQKALARFKDIRRNNQIDHKNFMLGSIAMPFIGVLAAFLTYLFQGKWFRRK